MSYERLLTYGNIIQTSITCDVNRLLNETSNFPYRQYNTNKLDNKRYGLSVTSKDGSINGDDLESLYELNDKTGSVSTELDFTTLTGVYYSSRELRRLVDPFKEVLGRTHILHIPKGGYFPPHRDDWGSLVQPSFRVIVPLVDCTPPNLYFILDGHIVHLNHGYAYFINTNLEHSVFSFSDQCRMLIMNVRACYEAYEIVLTNMFKK